MKTPPKLKLIALLLWTFSPCLALHVGLDILKSAVWAYGLYHLVCLAPAVYLGRALWLPSWKKPSREDWIIIIALAVITSVGAIIGYELFGDVLLSNARVPVLMKELGITRGLYILFGLYACAVNPFMEEIFWRGVVFNELEKLKTPFKHFPIVWSSCTYALFHYFVFRLVLYPGWAELGVIMLVGFGALMAVLYRRSGSIVTPALAHGLSTDLACIVLMLDYFRRFGLF